jgi:hypothetical protein
MDDLDKRQLRERCHLVRCQLCGEAEVYYPDIALCEECEKSNSEFVRKIKELYFRGIDAKGSVRASSGGLPSLGKRR